MLHSTTGDAPAISPAASPRRRGAVILLALAALLAIMFVVAVGTGGVSVRPGQVISILLDQIGIDTGIAFEARQRSVVTGIRLPRVLLGMLLGASLGVAGASLQGLFRNPLADPSLIGVSSGSALGVTLLNGLGRMLGSTTAPATLPAAGAAFTGAIITTLIIYRLATYSGRTNVATMLLAGVAINALAGALVGLLVFLAGGAITGTQDILFWSLGNLGRATWASLTAVLPIIAAAVIVLLRLARPLNALLLGEAEAEHLGVNIERTKQLIVVMAALAVGAGVAVAGVIGFVALVVPHLLRLSFGPDHRVVLPGAALLGATLLIGADLIARVVAFPAELPLGIITALVGGPFFLWLLLRDRSRGALV